MVKCSPYLKLCAGELQAILTMTEPDIQLVLCTCPDAAVAASISQHLVQQGLAACVNQLPGVTSTFAWQGDVQSETEVLLLIKSTADRFSALESAIRQLHPYELPEIIAVPIQTGLPEYLNWVKQSCS